MRVKQGSFAAPTGTGNVSYDCGFQPKVILFWGTKQTADGAVDGWQQTFGIAIDSTHQVACDWRSTDNVSTSVTGSSNIATECFYLPGGSECFANLVSMDTNGFTLNFDTVSSAYIVNYLALGGADLTNVALEQITSPTSTGSAVYTGAGFQPDAILTLSAGSATVPPAQVDHLRFMVGAATASTKFAVGESAVNGLTTTVTGRVNNAAGPIDTWHNGAIYLRATLTSLDATGCTLNWTTVQASAHYHWILYLKGGSYFCGTDTPPTSATPKTTTGVGFVPKALLIINPSRASSFNETTATLSIGAGAIGATALDQGMIYARDRHGVTTTNSSTVLDRTKIIQTRNYNSGTAPPAVLSEASLDSFDADGFTLNWTTAEATQRAFCYLAIGGQSSGIFDRGVH